jgi:hypothetical protein
VIEAHPDEVEERIIRRIKAGLALDYDMKGETVDRSFADYITVQELVIKLMFEGDELGRVSITIPEV